MSTKLKRFILKNKTGWSLRIPIGILLALSVFFLPWWLPFFAGIFLLFYFESYFEIFLVGFLIDAMYAVSIPLYYHFQFFASLLAVLFFLVSNEIKKRMAFYN